MAGSTSRLDFIDIDSMPLGTPNGSATGSSDTQNSLAPGTATASAPRRRTVPRKGHTKSRKGCHRCKSRKVKCSEQKPDCLQCQRLGYQCRYTDPNEQPARPTPSVPVRSTAGIFHLEDLRFFHHFMVTAYPTLPLGHATVWRETAAVAHGYGFLAHSILGLAATHLTNSANTDFSAQALNHRVIAIRLVNERLCDPIQDIAIGNAVYAALMCLTQQTLYMKDAMVEFLTIKRGCRIVGGSLLPSLEGEPAFKPYTSSGHAADMRKVIKKQGEPVKDIALFDAFEDSVLQLEPLCTRDTEVNYHAELKNVINIARISSADAWETFTGLSLHTEQMNEEEFASFVSPQNWTAQLLLVHFFLVDFLLGEFVIRPNHSAFRRTRKKVILSWIDNIDQGLPTNHAKYMSWPRSFCSLLKDLDSSVLRATWIPPSGLGQVEIVSPYSEDNERIMNR
ncbi:hypothetical protein BKA67DRAFT_694886 [Truncatella angustata]|uniref:Zn(2)-C6 fungal-type domain-containing protein n=1 Tax=Truncatella angustata TaxID=152316 RepID=A0A9P8RKV4_9PEZI|nr:uncharacterized protein BKA67DRAFT_694886 [Truncatella angustata]KAH6647920.1 hypothetical protein BKA67DRAFT_694886 [Truncatella angustata]